MRKPVVDDGIGVQIQNSKFLIPSSNVIGAQQVAEQAKKMLVLTLMG